MKHLRGMLAGEPDMSEVGAYLDELDGQQRVSEIRALGRSHQEALFEAAKGHKPVALEDIVPSHVDPMQEVVHLGKNSLPVFNHFAKAFVRPGTAPSTELWGYNRAGGFIETVIGPGYFVAYPHDVPGEILIDYLRLPTERPEHWPVILSNSAGLSRFVYGGTRDVLRGVSRHVTIGRATRDGQPMSAWFVLCRQDPT